MSTLMPNSTIDLNTDFWREKIQKWNSKSHPSALFYWLMMIVSGMVWYRWLSFSLRRQVCFWRRDDSFVMKPGDLFLLHFCPYFCFPWLPVRKCFEVLWECKLSVMIMSRPFFYQMHFFQWLRNSNVKPDTAGNFRIKSAHCYQWHKSMNFLQNVLLIRSILGMFYCMLPLIYHHDINCSNYACHHCSQSNA